MKKLMTAAAVAALALGGLTACGESSSGGRAEQYAAQEKKSDKRAAPNVTGDAEYGNYMKAQEEVYDNPASVIWCTVYPENPAAPIFTVPIAGKLTSSSVSYFPGSKPEKWSWGSEGGYMQEAKSVDGMYHGNPPAYRYGFTPGGQYVDFTALPTFCTTQLTEFQRQSLKVAQVDAGDSVTQQASDLLAQGKTAEAQALIDGLSE